MRDSGIRDIQALAAAAAELQAIRGDGSRRRTHREVPIAAPRAVHADAPVDVNELSHGPGGQPGLEAGAGRGPQGRRRAR